jgi:YidC/Oxa1 family membrane protein insertase
MANLGYWICFPFAALLRLFYTLTGSYGVSLILFTLVIKLILLPFQMKSKKSMVRMSRMSGKVQEIQKKYANNQAKATEEIQKIYAEEGANPLSGCLWTMLPMPILFALYYIIREPIVFFMNFGTRTKGIAVVAAAKKAITAAGFTLTGNKAYEQIEIVTLINKHGSKFVDFVQKYQHGWVNIDYKFLGMDLSVLPSSAFKAMHNGMSWAVIGLILIPVLSGLLQLLVTKITMKGQPVQEGAAGASSKTMMYMMPLISVYFGFVLPAALGIYWIAQSGLSAIQEALMGKFYNGKIEAEEDERQKKIEADRHARQEAARLRQEEQKKMGEKQAAAAKKKAAKSTQNKGKVSTNENGRIGDRPYARGRAFSENHEDAQNNGKK